MDAQRTHGFSLVELVIVMVLAGIVLGVSAPRFFAVQDFNARFFTDEVLATIRYAQRLAVVTGCDVQFSVSGNTYTLNHRQSCAAATSFTVAIAHPGTGASAFSGSAPSGASLSSTVNPFYFDRVGRVRNASGAVVSPVVSVSSNTINVVGETGYSYET